MSDLSRRGLLGGAVAIGAAGVALAGGAPALAAGTATEAAGAGTATAASTAAFTTIGGIVKKLEFPIYRLDVLYTPITESLSPFETGQTTFQASSKTSDNRLSLQINKAFEEEAEEFATLRELYDSAFGAPHLIGTSPDPQELAIVIARRGNLIAARSRRGPGLVVLHSPSTEFRETLNSLGEHYRIHESPALADNELVVLYEGGQGIHDGPFMAEVREDGTVRAVVRRSSSVGLGNSTDMGVIIRAA